MDAPATEDKKPTPEVTKDQLYVKIYGPFKDYYDGIAQTVTAANDTGVFDVLAQHHNFITILNQGDVTVRDDQGEHKIAIERGVMHVHANKVIVFLDV